MRIGARWPALVLVLSVCVTGFLWVAVYLLWQQEQQIEKARGRERLENALSLVVRESERAWASSGEPIGGSLLFAWKGERLWRTGGVPLLWSPGAVGGPEEAGDRFVEAETIEFQKGEPARAMREYEALLRDSSASVRAGALLRLARCQRTLGDSRRALDNYSRLMQVWDAWVAGAPARWVGLRESIILLTARGAGAEADQARSALRGELAAGGWIVDRATFEFFERDAGRVPAGRPWAEAMEQLWPKMQGVARGMEVVEAQGIAFAAEWRGQGREGVGRLVQLETVQAKMRQTLGAAAPEWALTGFAVEGRTHAGGLSAERKQAETGLPWGVRVWLGQESPARVPALAAAMLAMSILIPMALYLAYRSLKREQALVRQQSEFVASVSHEFRTPITALTHLTEMLESGAAPAERVPLYYRTLGGETRRLRDLVENLLDFGRLEAGSYRFRPERVDAVAFARDVVEEFRRQPDAGEYKVVFESGVSEAEVGMDREAMRRALCNLLENAVKYSPAGSRILTRVSSSGAWTSVSVQDEGPGIAVPDQRRIFQKFVRGGGEANRRVSGAGIGLALVESIVRAHGGRVELQSELGAGSCFTILLPGEGNGSWQEY